MGKTDTQSIYCNGNRVKSPTKGRRHIPNNKSMELLWNQIMDNKWVTYQNGNYVVHFNIENGTKIRETDEEDFIPSFAECCDVKITDRCDGDCPMCYEGCTPAGKHGRTDYAFFNYLHPYTEMALNGNDLSHPDLIPFLRKMKAQKVIANMTVNQLHFERHQELIRKLIDEKLIYGLGISLREPTEEFIRLVKTYSNAVIHTINGILTKEDVQKLQNHNLKILVLGYKYMRRGESFYDANTNEIQENQKWLCDHMGEVIPHFNTISFDNLAIKQLNIRRFFTDEEWQEFYVGDDAEFTFYIDLVEGTFGKNSLAAERFPVCDSIDEMFEKIRKK